MAPDTGCDEMRPNDMVMSFRLRMIAAAAAVVAIALGLVLAFSWSSVRELELERLDARLCLEARRLATQPFGPADVSALETDLARKLRVSDAERIAFRVAAVRGPAFASSAWQPAWHEDGVSWQLGALNLGGEAVPGGSRCDLARTGAAAWHVARVSGREGIGLVAADATAAADELRAAAQRALQVIVPVALLLVVAGAWVLSTISMRPLLRLRDALRGIGPADLGRRLAGTGEDREFRDLIDACNAMLDRLQTSFEQATRFSADAAHELRTPLMILQGRLEQAIRLSEGRALQADLADMQEEVGRLASITRKLLMLSQSDAGQLLVHRHSTDLSAMLSSLAGDARMLAEGGQVDVQIEDGLIFPADPDLLRQLLNNLVSNAIRYRRRDGWIRLRAARCGSVIEVTFANSTDPLPAEARRRIFDRFYRLDPARNRASEGSGLGLSLAREIARAHGGDLVLDLSPADEFRLRLRLPAE